MYIPKPIIWGHDPEDNTTYSKNTFNSYVMQYLEDCIWCFYDKGKYKEFSNIEDAKEWVSEVHYPAQIEKYFTLNQSNLGDTNV